MTSRPSVFCRRRAVAGLAVAASLLLTTACNNGGSSPGATPVTEAPSASVASTPTPTPSPTPSYKPADASGRAQNVPVPVLPEEAKAETKQGLEAFARYWFSTLTYAYETGDIKPLESISSPDCVSCGRAKRVVQGWHSEGRWLAGGKMVVEGAESKFTEAGTAEYQVLIQVYQEALSYYRADKSLDEKTEPSPAVGDIMLATYGDGAWKALTVEHLAKSQ